MYKKNAKEKKLVLKYFVHYLLKSHGGILHEIDSGELNKKRRGISKKPLGWYANGHRGELLIPHVKLNEDNRIIK
jgi:hypothetical protein